MLQFRLPYALVDLAAFSRNATRYVNGRTYEGVYHGDTPEVRWIVTDRPLSSLKFISGLSNFLLVESSLISAAPLEHSATAFSLLDSFKVFGW